MEKNETKSKKRGLAYVFVKTEVGQEERVLNQIKKASCVNEAHILLGGYYDILLKVTYGNPKELKDTVVFDIRTNKYVESTLTLIALKRVNYPDLTGGALGFPAPSQEASSPQGLRVRPTRTSG